MRSEVAQGLGWGPAGKRPVDTAMILFILPLRERRASLPGLQKITRR